MVLWTQAYDLWLESRRSPNTRRAYRMAWESFLDSTSKLPWEIGKSDVARWVEGMRTSGLSAATIRQRMAAVSSFYSYTMRVFTVAGAGGREQPLHNFNPVQAVPRPEVTAYAGSRYLSIEETRAFLRAIPRYTVQGKRDYALFLTYLATGRRNSEIRNLKWGDFDRKGSVQYFSWKGKRKQRRDEFPAIVWHAVSGFLKAASRLEGITPDDYIFTPLTDRATRLPNVDSRTWDRNRPLSMREVGRLLNKYARRAGMDPQKVCVHTLRHTAAMLRKQAGDDIESISNFLGHSSLAVTQIYLHQIEGRRDSSWVKVQALLGLNNR
jgi:site-specific recombinase XerD